MLEDLFSVVKVRFNGDKTEDDKKKTDIPKGLLFKCPRCRNVTFMEEFNKKTVKNEDNIATKSYGEVKKWFLFPLPITELNKGYGLVQNPGWE